MQMSDHRMGRARALPARFVNFARRIDRRRLVELERGRPARLVKARIPAPSSTSCRPSPGCG
jgi:hypothetical protein